MVFRETSRSFLKYFSTSNPVHCVDLTIPNKTKMAMIVEKLEKLVAILEEALVMFFSSWTDSWFVAL